MDIFYQDLEDAVSIFGFITVVHITTARDVGPPNTEYKNGITEYLSITKPTMESHCEIPWTKSSVTGLG